MQKTMENTRKAAAVLIALLLFAGIALAAPVRVLAANNNEPFLSVTANGMALKSGMHRPMYLPTTCLWRSQERRVTLL